jgi:hypothetical protein
MLHASSRYAKKQALRPGVKKEKERDTFKIMHLFFVVSLMNFKMCGLWA